MLEIFIDTLQNKRKSSPSLSEQVSSNSPDKLYLIKNIHDVIIRKLQSAGLYRYALEEFGKLILGKESKSKNNQYEINCSWFKTPKAHKYKFPKAFDYLEENHHEKCYVLNDEGVFDAEGFSRQGFDLGLLPNFKARLSIFYSDFKAKGKNDNDIDIVKVPSIDKNMLQNAIDEIEKAVKEL
jgi:hypothetical protein